mmetsp:Transcript_11484/g.18821  ORF Transcript_11484/g.18821 Transcript_11484/m.18821 type:complete len:284 (+) Transcript_11484:117-968(+)
MSEQPTQLHADDPLVIGAEEGEEEEDGRSFGSLDASGLMSVVDADAIENVTLPTSWEFRDVLEFDNEKDLYSDEISMMHDVLVKKNNDNRKQQDAGWFPDCWMAFALFSKPGGDAVCFKTLNGGLPPSKICADGTVAAEERRFLSNERGKVSGAKKAGRQQRRMEQVAAAKNGSVSEISGSGSGPAAKKPKMEHAVHHTISFMPNKTEELNAQIERKKAIVSLMEQMGKPAYQIKQAKEQLLDLMLKADANDEEEPEEDDVDAEGDDEDAEGDDQDEEDEDDE